MPLRSPARTPLAPDGHRQAALNRQDRPPTSSHEHQAEPRTRILTPTTSSLLAERLVDDEDGVALVDVTAAILFYFGGVPEGLEDPHHLWLAQLAHVAAQAARDDLSEGGGTTSPPPRASES